ncbi:hypothetical protein [Acerihabitans arboris]|uniref:Uncharacterized protein n=1 Tax=Acerihabitans arboris TaxID=2691583 RepID=A0A845SLV2_9GAMM|nr:hypothetical protein [Acerihabitans arboris]NDL65900.1 hypothetical protein [Acerihabitans arboris]
MANCEVKIWKGRKFSRTSPIVQARYPFDVSKLASQIPGMVLHWYVDPDYPSSLLENRITGTAMTAVGAPVINGYKTILNEANHIDTGIDISQFNGMDLTIIAIAGNAGGGPFNLAGRLQVANPQRSRALKWVDATHIGNVWLNSNGSTLAANLTPVNITSVDADMFCARFISNNGSNFIASRITMPRSGANAQAAGAATAYAMPSTNILIGGSLDGGTTVSCDEYSVAVFNRLITDDELALYYETHKNRLLLAPKPIYI